jgi:hypothetical protein
MVTDRQFRRLRTLLQTERTLAHAADRAGLDEKTARKYRDSETLPSQRTAPHTRRTREDPFQDVWPELQEKLRLNPGLQAKTLFLDLQRRFPGRYPDGQLRTLQRRIKQWRALEGPPKEVFFAQIHEPGQLCASDFTHMTELGVTIAGEPFDHLVYHFVLTYSNWETGTVCFSESWESLCDGLQNALWELGGVPRLHRTDRLGAAVQADPDPERFTRRYQELLAHYGLKPQAIAARQAHQNGDVEQSHHRFKQAVDQALLLRGSRDFAARGEYRASLRKIMAGRNANRRERFAEELMVLSAPPARRLEMRRVKARVDTGSTIHVGGNTYSLASRLIGEWVGIRIGAGSLGVWHGVRRVDHVPRLRGRGKHRIDYRHIIDWLVRKPGAFEAYRYRDASFPTSRFRMAYDVLTRQTPARAAAEYLAILHLAAREGETAVDEALRWLLDQEQPLGVSAVAELVAQGRRLPPVTDVTVAAVDLRLYDQLLLGEEVNDHEPRGHESAIDCISEGVAPAHGAEQLRGAGPPGPAGIAQLRAIPAGAGRAGVPGAAWASDRAVAAGVAAAAGEDPGGAEPEAAPAEGGAAGAGPAGRDVPGPVRERAGLRQPGQREDPCAIINFSGIDSFRATGLFPGLWLDGSGPAGGQAGPEAEPAVQELSRYEALVLDDLGYVQQSREEMEVLFSLLSERYERGSVLLSGNLAFSGWESIFKDAMMTAAAIDRLVHHCVIVELNVPSYRAEQAGKARQTTTTA